MTGTNPSRGRRAALTGGASIARQASRVLVLGITTPFLIDGLGIERYGLWLAIQQAVSIAVLADLRAGGTLKFSLATRQDLDDEYTLRRQVGSALRFWLQVTPLIALAGLVLSFILAPQISHNGTSLVELRWTLAIAFLTTAADRILSLPAQALRGMNLGYRSIWLDAFTLNLGPIGAAAAAMLDQGLIGVALAFLVGMLLANATRFLVARRLIPWFGVARPFPHESRQFSRLSSWLIVGDLANLLLLGTEILIVGIVVNTEAAAVYATTQFVIRTAGSMATEVLASGGPGVAQLASRSAWQAVQTIRDETFIIASATVAALSSAVLLANDEFVRKWTDDSLYGGKALETLLVCAAGLTLLTRIDAVFVDASLAFRDRSVRALTVALITLPAMVVTGMAWGVVGLASATVGGRLLLFCTMPSIIGRSTHRSSVSVVVGSTRSVFGVVIVVAVSALLSTRLRPEGWLDVIMTATSGSIAGGAAFIVIGTTGQQRAALVKRLTRSIRHT